MARKVSTDGVRVHPEDATSKIFVLRTSLLLLCKYGVSICLCPEENCRKERKIQGSRGYEMERTSVQTRPDQTSRGWTLLLLVDMVARSMNGGWQDGCWSCCTNQGCQAYASASERPTSHFTREKRTWRTRRGQDRGGGRHDGSVPYGKL